MRSITYQVQFKTYQILAIFVSKMGLLGHIEMFCKGTSLKGVRRIVRPGDKALSGLWCFSVLVFFCVCIFQVRLFLRLSNLVRPQGRDQDGTSRLEVMLSVHVPSDHPQQSCGKVMFLRLSVILFKGESLSGGISA